MSKFDFNKLVENVKSIIQPDSIIPKNLEGDPIAAKLTLLRESMQNLTDYMEKQQGEIAKINVLINALYQDLSALKPPAEPPSFESGEKKK